MSSCWMVVVKCWTYKLMHTLPLCGGGGGRVYKVGYGWQAVDLKTGDHDVAAAAKKHEDGAAAKNGLEMECVRQPDPPVRYSTHVMLRG